MVTLDNTYHGPTYHACTFHGSTSSDYPTVAGEAGHRRAGWPLPRSSTDGGGCRDLPRRQGAERRAGLQRAASHGAAHVHLHHRGDERGAAAEGAAAGKCEYGHGQNSRGEYGHSPRAWLHALRCAEFEGHAYHGYTRHGRHCRAPSSRGCCIPSSRRTSGNSSPWVGCSACGWASFRRSSSLEIVPPNEPPDEVLALGGGAVRRATSTLTHPHARTQPRKKACGVFAATC